MKKVLAAIVTVAIMLSLFAISSSAAWLINFDGAYLTNDADVNATHGQTPWIPLEGESDVKNATNAGDIGYIYGSGYKYYHIQGWISDDVDFTDLGYQIGSGDIVWGQRIEDPNLVAVKANTGHEYPYRFFITVELPEEDSVLKLIKKDGSGETVVKEIAFANKKSDKVVFAEKAVSGYDGSPANGLWLNKDGQYAAVEFTTTDQLGGVTIFFWASNGTNGPLGKWTADLYKFAYNVENTLAGDPVASTELAWAGDNNPAFAWKFDEPLEAGTYIFKMTIVGETATGKSGETAYVVFPGANTAVDDTKYNYINTTVKFNFVTYGPSNVAVADFYAANPADTEVPGQIGGNTETNAKTGDMTVAMFAVIAVLAMGAAVVFMKKKTY